MYDVVRCKPDGNDKIIYCVSDKNETKLLEKYSKAMEENGFHGKKQKNFNFEQFIFCFNNGKPGAILSGFLSKNILFPKHNVSVLIGYKNTILQPPRNPNF
jgi:predicted membrane metal-binding protein